MGEQNAQTAPTTMVAIQIDDAGDGRGCGIKRRCLGDRLFRVSTAVLVVAEMRLLTGFMRAVRCHRRPTGLDWQQHQQEETKPATHGGGSVAVASSG